MEQPGDHQTGSFDSHVSAALLLGTAVTNSQEREKSLTKARIDSYDRIKDDLNRIHCFMLEVGTWKEESPSTMIGYKRAIDREMNEERAIWSPQTFQAYSEFDRAVFAHTGVSGDDAAIRADVGQKHNSPSWNSATDDAKLRPPDLNYKEKYKNLYDSLQNDITKQ